MHLKHYSIHKDADSKGWL